MPLKNRQIRLMSRPDAEAKHDDFALVEQELPSLEEGQVLVKNHYLSLDPYMRGRMNDSKSYATPQPLDTVMLGATVGEVVQSKNPYFAEGDSVLGMGGWQEYTIVDASRRGVLQKVDPARVPLSAYLGAVGMPGVTAHYGLHQIIAPRAGQTVVVSAATGAVGSVVGQLAKQAGCRVVGFAGGPEKCRYATDELGYDVCIDYKKQRDLRALSGALAEAAPHGVDGCFENVGGMLLDAVLEHMNAFGRIALCGLIAGYDGQPIPLANPQLLLTNRLSLRGFIVSEHMEAWPEALKVLGGLMAAGKLKYRESVADGIASAPAAFLGMLKGQNFGKQLVKL